MCGIAGFAGGFWPALAQKMNAAQKHRGPDGDGVFEDPEAGIGLAHVRLAILDLSHAASQPMHSADGRFVLVFNGEIYNFRELRSKLESGWVFRSSGDTEVLLAGLALQGPSFISQLNGIFAFALWDRKHRKLMLARDPLGVKPLYWTEPKRGTLVFSSEIKSILLHPDLTPAPDFYAIQEHLARGHASGTRTAFKGIERLPQGAILSWCATDRKAQVVLCEPPDLGANTGTYEASVENLRTAVAEGVQRQMVSDVPVGTFLSGGLDSSTITLLASKHAEQPLQCFTISYPSSENRIDQYVDDLPYAREVADVSGLPLTNIEIKPDVAGLLPQLIAHMDEPLVDPAIITCYLICKLARERGVPVLLSGQGADELFAGYPRYPAVEMTRVFEKLPKGLRRSIARLAYCMPAGLEGRSGAGIRRTRRVLLDVDKSADARFMAYASAQCDSAITGIFSPEVRAEIGGRHSAEYSFQLMESSGVLGGNRYIHRDLADYLPNHNLLYTDKMSMAVGVEVRVPLLDPAIVSLARNCPFEYKCRGKITKRIFRDAVRTLVPDSILTRPKAGFGAPYRKWLRYDLKEMWFDVVNDSSARRRGWFDPAALDSIRACSDSGREDLYMLQWAILTVELWARAFNLG